MGRGEQINYKRNLKKRVRYKDKGSDDSDEDYVVENEENLSDDDSEDCQVSLDGYASEESFDSFVEEEEGGEGEEEEEFRKPVRSKKKRSSLGKGKIEGKASRKRKRVSHEEEEEEEDEDEEYVNGDGDEDDEEFTLDEEDDDCLDEDDELTAGRKNRNVKVVKRRVSKRGSGRATKRRRKSRVMKKPLEKKGVNKRRLKKKERCEYEDEDDGDFFADSPVAREKSKKTSGVRKRKFSVNSDSDFVSNGSSDYEYTLSEEEREQVREASHLYGELKTSLRSSSVGKRIQENGDLCQQTKPVGRKGKEKVKEVKSELGKQVCGICLSEEDKRRLRGTLDCCSHYFCFTCIMEWSKVESRCPLCKQRFSTIAKNGRSAMGVDLRNMVIQVPMRDQVYQPTEEEIRSYIDPYENVICKECHEGGDDGLMLLCDLCDSSAHTYCVGLGRQVPEGNWYCDDCRPVALGSTSSQAQDPLPDQWNSSNNIFNRPSPILNLDEGLDPNLESAPRLTIPQVSGSLSSPRFLTGDIHGASPVSVAGASTLSGRRHLHRHIRILLSNRNPSANMNPVANRIDAISAASLHSDFLNSQIDPVRETALQNLRTQEIGTSEQTPNKERLQANDHPSSSFQNRDPYYLTPNQSRRQTVQDPTITTADRPVNSEVVNDVSSGKVHSTFNRCMDFDTLPNLGHMANENDNPPDLRESFPSFSTMIRIRSKKILKDSLDNQGNGGCDLSTDKSANMTQYPVKEMLEHDGSSGNTPEYKGDGLEESDTRIGEISMPSLDDSVGSRSHPKKMFDVVYRRSKPGRGKINSERDGSIREETSIACNPHLDSRGDSYEGTIGGSHRIHSMGSKGTHDANIAINDLHLGQGHESDDTCRDAHNGSVSRFQLPCEEWGSSSRMTVRLRSTRNRKASCHFHDTSPVDGRRKLHQSAKRVSWLMLSMHEEGSRYIPQQGDELAYLRQGHQEYIDCMKSKEAGPWKTIKGNIRAVEFCKVEALEYAPFAGSGDSCCKMTLKFIDPTSNAFQKSFKLTLPEMTGFPDFLVEKTRFDAAIQRDWSRRDKCKVWWKNEGEEDGDWWYGRVLYTKPKSSEFPESPWERCTVQYKSDPKELHNHSPWELFDDGTMFEQPHIDEETMNKLLFAFAKLERAGQKQQDHYGVEKLKQVSQTSRFTNGFAVPLSLEVIQARLENNYYRSLEALKHDFEVMLLNAESYFAKKADLLTKMKRLSNWFARTLSSL